MLSFVKKNNYLQSSQSYSMLIKCVSEAEITTEVHKIFHATFLMSDLIPIENSGADWFELLIR